MEAKILTFSVDSKIARNEGCLESLSLKVKSVKEDMKAEISTVKEDLQADIKKVKEDIKVLD